MTKSFNQLAIVIITAIALFGCVRQYVPVTLKPATAQELEVGRNAKKPESKEAALKTVSAYFSTSLKDPFSARWVGLDLVHGQVIFNPYQRHFGWFLCGGVNARNSFGGYVGQKMFYVFFDPQDASRVSYGIIDDELAEAHCVVVYKETFSLRGKK